MPNFNEMIELNVILIFFSATVLFLLMVGCLLDKGRKKPFMRNFIFLLGNNILMLLGEAGLHLFAGKPSLVVLLKISAIFATTFGYTGTILYAFCLVEFVREKRPVHFHIVRIFAAACAVFALIPIISYFNGCLFYTDENGFLHYTALYEIIALFDIVVFIYEVTKVFIYRKALSKRELFALFGFIFLPILCVVLLPYWDATPLYLTNALTLTMIYTLFHEELARQKAEVRRKEAADALSAFQAQLKKEICEDSVAQIRALCKSDPAAAEDAIASLAVRLSEIAVGKDCTDEGKIGDENGNL